MENSKKIALVTGASSGIGKATVKEFIDAGFTVYAASRRIEKMKDLEALGARILKMDVTDNDSMEAGVKTIIENEGAVDILVNNAGYGSYGVIEDVPLDEARRQFEVNIFGLARLIQLVLPGMREKHFGRIINISSMGGKMYTPFGGWYHATKHALEGLSDSLRLEIKPFGIDVAIIEPGGIKTPWGKIAADNLRGTSNDGAYAEAACAAADALEKRYNSPQMTPSSVVAETILKAASARRPKIRYAVGYGARLSIFLRGLLPDRIFDRVIQIAF